MHDSQWMLCKHVGELYVSQRVYIHTLEHWSLVRYHGKTMQISECYLEMFEVLTLLTFTVIQFSAMSSLALTLIIPQFHSSNKIFLPPSMLPSRLFVFHLFHLKTAWTFLSVSFLFLFIAKAVFVFSPATAFPTLKLLTLITNFQYNDANYPFSCLYHFLNTKTDPFHLLFLFNKIFTHLPEGARFCT